MNTPVLGELLLLGGLLLALRGTLMSPLPFTKEKISPRWPLLQTQVVIRKLPKSLVRILSLRTLPS